MTEPAKGGKASGSSGPGPYSDLPHLVPDDARVRPDELAGMRVLGWVVNHNQSPNFTEIAALLDPSTETYPGQFLGVLHGRGRSIITIVQVSNTFEINPNESPDLVTARNALGLERRYGQEGVSTRIFRLAEAATVEEFDFVEREGRLVELGEGRAPQLLARAGDLVVALPPELVTAAIGGLPDPSQGLHLGDTHGEGGVPVVVPPHALQLHIGIFGNPGKGKSYASGNVLEEANAWGIPCLVLDVNGENHRAVEELGGKVIVLPDTRQFGLSLNLITPQELVAITPNVQLGTVYAELIELAHDQLRTESRTRSITFDMLRARIAQIGDSTKAAKTSIGAAIARVSTLEKDPLVGGDFNFVEQLERHRIVALDCRFLSLRQTQLIAAMGARELQRIGRERARAAEEGGDREAASWFALYFVDEAHAVIPDDAGVVSTQVFLELARMGRHVRTGLVLASQSPADLNTSVLKRLQLRLVFALERDQLRSIQGVTADLDDRIISQLPKLPRGVCAVSGASDVVRHGFLLDVRARRTTPGGGTPPVFAGRVKGPPRAAPPDA